MTNWNPICAAMGWKPLSLPEVYLLEYRGRMVGHLIPCEAVNYRYEGVYGVEAHGKPNPCLSIIDPTMKPEQIKRLLANKLAVPFAEIDQVVATQSVRAR